MRVLLRRVPKKTDPKLQREMMESWYETIVETYAPKTTVPEIHTGKTKPAVETETSEHPTKSWNKVR